MNSKLPLGALLLALSGCVDYEVCTSHYADGPAMSVRYYQGGVAHRPWVIFTHDKRERAVTNYEQGARDGAWRTLGRISMLFQREYEDDQPAGKWTRYWADGSLQEQGTFRDGLKSGTWRRWLPTGDLIEQAEFSEGVYDGRVQRWSAAGDLEFDKLYARGARVVPPKSGSDQ